MENTQAIESKQKITPIGVLKIVGNVIFYAFILLLLFLSIMNINAGSKNGGFPNIFGKGFLAVLSDSMSLPEGADLPDEYDTYNIKQFDKGDLLYVDVLDENGFKNLKKGDVVTFFDKSLNSLNTHRIVYITTDSEGKTASVSIQGDKQASERGVFDPTDESKASNNMQLQEGGLVVTFSVSDASQIKGIVTGVSKGTGTFVNGVRENWWITIVIVGVFLIVELFFVFKNFMELKGAKQQAALATDKEAMMAEIQAEKEAMRAQLLAELKAQQEAEEKERMRQELLKELEQEKETKVEDTKED